MKPMAASGQTRRFRFWLWLIRVIGVIVPRRLRADWRQEWEAAVALQRDSAGWAGEMETQILRLGSLFRISASE